jgi:hypothetical protein
VKIHDISATSKANIVLQISEWTYLQWVPHREGFEARGIDFVKILGPEYADKCDFNRLGDFSVGEQIFRLADRNLSERGILIWGTHPYTFQSHTYPGTASFGGLSWEILVARPLRCETCPIRKCL